ncbi:hypothetical protein QC762_0073000 [Podospora pseudocomata]|uniref:Uncharacterized protein n=1 Tax=Podospora pseudocomata TaxID=2093779 RepID=A0ABR0GHM9_9PEZI|nr:hypothetical protein QC762_0073000 [Podospora pseudocomata]
MAYAGGSQSMSAPSCFGVGGVVEGERTQGPREGRCNGILSIKQSNPRGQVEPGIERAKINDACGVKASFKDTDEETSRYQSRLRHLEQDKGDEKERHCKVEIIRQGTDVMREALGLRIANIPPVEAVEQIQQR